MKALVLAICLALCGCPKDPHTVERAENAAIGAEHQIELEVCLKQVQLSKKSDAGASQIESDFERCMATADARAGKK